MFHFIRETNFEKLNYYKQNTEQPLYFINESLLKQILFAFGTIICNIKINYVLYLFIFNQIV